MKLVFNCRQRGNIVLYLKGKAKTFAMKKIGLNPQEVFIMKDIFTNIEQQIENIDAKIEGIVKNATDSNQYEKLNQRINEMVNASTSTLDKGYKRAETVVKNQADKLKSSYDLQQEKVREVQKDFQNYQKKVKEKFPQEREVKQGQQMASPHLFAKKDGVHGGGIAMAIVGFIFSGLFSLAVLSMWLMNAITFHTTGFWNTLNRTIFLPGFWIFLIMGIIGCFMASRAKRYKKYIKVLNYQTGISMKNMAMYTGKTESYLHRDLTAMSRANWFKQGRISADKEMFFVDLNAYASYMEDVLAANQVQEIKQQQEQMREALPQDTKVIVTQGEEFLKKIHAKKVEISDYELTVKLTHLETILKKIFNRVSTHPETAPLVRKSIDFYLPTTVKLLDAYVQLDKQAIAGENIAAAKDEIDASLDTLTVAYEKLLDDLFADVMLDVSTDISVLNTMLAQDGLTTGNDFKND